MSKISIAERKRILERDGYACACGETLLVDVHHMKWVSQGGNNDEANLVSLCYMHHLEQHPVNSIRQVMLKNYRHRLDAKREELLALHLRLVAALYGLDSDRFVLDHGYLIVVLPDP